MANKYCPKCNKNEGSEKYHFDDEFECEICKKKFYVAVSFTTGNLIFREMIDGKV